MTENVMRLSKGEFKTTAVLRESGSIMWQPMLLCCVMVKLQSSEDGLQRRILEPTCPMSPDRVAPLEFDNPVKETSALLLKLGNN